MPEITMKSRLQNVDDRIARACEAAGRNRSEVRLVAVSKGHPVEAILEAYSLGVRDFGESYVQEWLPKFDALKHLSDIHWHFVGHLQSNKAKFVVGKSHLIHSVDRVSVLEGIAKAAKNVGTIADVLIEVEVDSSDVNKGGTPQCALPALIDRIGTFPELRVKGIMGMGPAAASPLQLAPLYNCFVKTSLQIFQGRNLSEKDLIISLGMSDDLEVAIACGSTLVRIGTAIFGERFYPR